MAATYEQIEKSIRRAKELGYAYVVMYCDAFDYTDYCNECRDAAECLKTMENIKTTGNQVMEVYDLSMDLDTQLKERRAYHPPMEVPANAAN